MAHITISDYTPRETFTVSPGGSSGPFTLPAGFVVFTPSSDIKFYDDGVQLSYADPPGSSTQFAFSGTLIDGGYQGGTLTLGGVATSGSVMSAVRDIPIERTTDFSYPSSTLDLEGLNTQLDKLFAIFQDREANNERNLRQPVTDSTNIDYIPSSTARASKFLAFDSDGDPIASVGSASTGSVISAYAATFCDDATEAEFKATVNLESGVDVAGIATANTFTAIQTVSRNAENSLIVTGGSVNSIGLRINNTAARDYVFGSGSTAGPLAANGFFIYDNTAGAARLGIGTSGGIFVPVATGTDMGAGSGNFGSLYVNAVPVSRRARSTVTTGWVDASVVSFTHGLGSRAKGGQIWVECLVSTGGYSVGDQVRIDNYYDGGQRGAVLAIDSNTVVKALLADLYTAWTKGSTAVFVPVDTSWGVIIEAWA